MIGTGLHIATFAKTNRFDPTRTTSLRNAFAREMRRRFTELVMVIRKAVVDQDCFGLLHPNLHAFQMTVPPVGGFAFRLSADKIEAFEIWLQEQINKGILSVGQLQQIGIGYVEPWTNRYVFDSYKRGVIRARYEMIKAGINVPPLDATGGIMAAMSAPFHLDRVGLIYARVYSDLKGITSVMDTHISRILAQGIADGDGPALLARKMVSAINGNKVGELSLTDTLGRFIPARRRAEILARTEVIRAHHVAMIQEYRNWAVHGVIVQAEWMTAGDNRVCDKCAKLQGRIYPLDEIEGLIPLHPMCRCIALPFEEGDTKIPTDIMPKGSLAGTE
jgi:SPP1 gp7 family putative phage head morphogenesis protein